MTSSCSMSDLKFHRHTQLYGESWKSACLPNHSLSVEMESIKRIRYTCDRKGLRNEIRIQSIETCLGVLSHARHRVIFTHRTYKRGPHLDVKFIIKSVSILSTGRESYPDKST